MSTGIRVASLDDLDVEEGLQISSDVTGTEDDIALLRDTDGTVYALNDTCTHATASLSDGYVEDGYVECPVHASRFCLKNGKVSGLPATVDTVAHRVEVRDGEIYLFPNESPQA
jgi:3-phenylpropionate/trans-cinnamate dioxygenase ferredoxin subunit